MEYYQLIILVSDKNYLGEW